MFSMEKSNTADNVYVNISMKNKQSVRRLPATFNATYTEAILDNPSDHYCAVVKFEIPLSTLPLMVMPLKDRNDKERKQYLKYTTGTADSTVNPAGGSFINGSGTSFSPDMIGGTIVYASGATLDITGYVSPTQLLSSSSGVNPNQSYEIYNGTLYRKNTISQSGTTVTLDDLLFTSGFKNNMIGGTIIYSNGQVVDVTDLQNSITLTASAPLTINSSSYKLYYSYSPNISQFIVGVCQNNQPNTGVLGYSRNVEFVPVDQIVKPEDVDYPYVYSYNTLIEYMNQALFDAWVSAGSPGGVDNQPYFNYSSESNLINIVIPEQFYTAGGNKWTVYWNDEMDHRIPSFSTYISDVPELFYGRYEVKTSQLDYNSYNILKSESTPGAGDAIYTISQDYSTVDYLNSIRKIIMTTRTIPIRKEFYPPSNSVNSGVSNSISIMNDFQLDLSNTGGSQRQVALYEANPYRLIDMTSNTPFRRIDLQIFWADEENELRPLFLNAHESATVKLGFFSKKLFNNEIDFSE